MSRPINPPQQLRTPNQFLNDSDAVQFFDQQRIILDQLRNNVIEINKVIDVITQRLDALENP